MSAGRIGIVIVSGLAKSKPQAKNRQYYKEQDCTRHFVALPADLSESPLAALVEVDDSRHRSLPSAPQSGQQMSAAPVALGSDRTVLLTRPDWIAR